MYVNVSYVIILSVSICISSLLLYISINTFKTQYNPGSMCLKSQCIWCASLCIRLLVYWHLQHSENHDSLYWTLILTETPPVAVEWHLQCQVKCCVAFVWHFDRWVDQWPMPGRYNRNAIRHLLFSFFMEHQLIVTWHQLCQIKCTGTLFW